MFKDNRKVITIEEFIEKFCNKCYWQKHGNCDITRVKYLKYCSHSQVRTWELKLKEIE